MGFIARGVDFSVSPHQRFHCCQLPNDLMTHMDMLQGRQSQCVLVACQTLRMLGWTSSGPEQQWFGSSFLTELVGLYQSFHRWYVWLIFCFLFACQLANCLNIWTQNNVILVVKSRQYLDPLWVQLQLWSRDKKKSNFGWSWYNTSNQI